MPFGNAEEKFNNESHRWEFSCQHKENECYGNLMQTCAINLMGVEGSYDLIICLFNHIFEYDKNFDKTLDFCVNSELHYESYIQSEILSCTQSDIGNEYQHQMAQKTGKHNHVPWIIVDGEYDLDVENKIIDSLIDFICKEDYKKCGL